MRFLVALVLIIAASSGAVVNAVDAADNAAGEQVCTAADYADGTCAQPESLDDSSDDDEDSSDEAHEIDCVDRDVKCATYIKDSKGACQDNPGYMKHYCAETCNTCDAIYEAAKAAEFVEKGEFNEACKDDDYRCLEWAGMGECDANPGYMKKSCRNACLVCFEGTNQFGIGQRVPDKKEAPEDEIQKTKERIQQSTKFMQKVWTEEKYDDVRHKCKNQHQDCTWWAAMGECDANPKYMQTNCAPACETCDLLDIRHRCPIEPGNESIWKPGDLNSLMENIVDDADGTGEWKKYNPTAFSRPKLKRDGTPAPGVEKDGPWVVLLENFIQDEESDRLVDIGKKQGYERSADVGKEKPDGSHDSLVSESRTSHNSWCQEPSCFEDPLVSPVVERIANVTKTEVKNSEYLQMLQYEPGQYYKQHHDFIPHHKNMPCGVRILTLFIYLNDVEAGGGTDFPLLDLTVMPKKGNALLWPSVLDQAPESKDGRTDHQALPVEKGIKYGANAWIHSRDFKKAFGMNCH